MPKSDPSKISTTSNRNIKNIQTIINLYITTTTSNDHFEKRSHIQRLINSYKTTRKTKILLKQWVNNLLDNLKTLHNKITNLTCNNQSDTINNFNNTNNYNDNNQSSIHQIIKESDRLATKNVISNTISAKIKIKIKNKWKKD